jgi:hypothetical protein
MLRGNTKPLWASIGGAALQPTELVRVPEFEAIDALEARCVDEYKSKGK